MPRSTTFRRILTRPQTLGACSLASAAMAVAGLAMLAPAPAMPAATASAALAAGTYRVDNTHSSVMFRVKYMDSSYFFGRFNEIKGTYKLDADDLAGSSVDLTVNVDKVDTASQGRDRHLKNADFFNSPQFPEATFKSTKVESAGENTFRVTGDFTLRGVTKQITTEIKVTGTATDNRAQATRMGIYCEFDFNRSEFEVNYGIPGISDQTRVIVSLNGIEQK